MNKWVVRVGAVVLVVVMALGAIDLVAAQGPSGPNQPQGPQNGLLPSRPRVQLWGALINQVTEVTGLSTQDVVDEVRNGKTLSDILTEHSVDPATVSDAVKTQLTDEINQAVTDGQITQQRADLLLGSLDSALQRAMTALPLNLGLRERVGARVETTLLDVLAEKAGVSASDLLGEAVRPSLADIAAAHGVDVDVVISEAEQQITDQVNQAVANGTLTQAQADVILNGLHDRLVNRFNAPLGGMGVLGGMGFGGMLDDGFGMGFGMRNGTGRGNGMRGGLRGRRSI
jgi:uncharacterized protein YidB (DUF937 family)